MKSNSVIIGASVIIGCTILGIFMKLGLSNYTKENTDKPAESYYEMIPVNDNNLIIFNKKTGEYWRKFIPSNEGPTNWEKENSPMNK